MQPDSVQQNPGEGQLKDSAGTLPDFSDVSTCDLIEEVHKRMHLMEGALMEQGIKELDMPDHEGSGLLGATFNKATNSAGMDNPSLADAAKVVTMANKASELAEEQDSLPTHAEGQRVVRTKTTADRVYLLDGNTKMRHWVTTPEVLKGLGFELQDVAEVTDDEMLQYQQGPAKYRADS